MDQFFGSSQWLVNNEKTVVQHNVCQILDHCILVLDTTPEMQQKRRRFYFDKRWVEKLGVEKVMRQTWEAETIGSPMFQVAERIKC